MFQIAKKDDIPSVKFPRLLMKQKSLIFLICSEFAEKVWGKYFNYCSSFLFNSYFSFTF